MLFCDCLAVLAVVLLIAIQSVHISAGNQPDIHETDLAATATAARCYTNITDSETWQTCVNGTLLDISECELTEYDCLHVYPACNESGSRVFNISRNYFSDLQTDFKCSFQNASVIDLSYNKIFQIQKTDFSENINLIRLHLTGNDIYQIETEAFNNLFLLKVLDLSNNNLPGIQQHMFKGLVKMELLNVSRNLLRFISPESFSALGSLETLDLSLNHIELLDSDVFTGLTNLRFLYLQGNKIFQSSFQCLNIFKYLQILDLSNNYIDHLEPGAFTDINVKVINISNCGQLVYVMNKSFKRLSKTEIIDLRGNKNLIFVHKNTFIEAPNITTVQLTNTSVDFLPTTQNTTSIIVSGKPLRCDCYKHDDTVNQTKLICSHSEHVFFTWSDHLKKCKSQIVTNIHSRYAVVLGQRVAMVCFATGNPWPSVNWERAIWNGKQNVFEKIKSGYFLQLHIGSLNDEGKYRCIANSSNTTDTREFIVKILRIDIGIKVLTSDESSVVVTWNRTHYVSRHVILYRAYEETIIYNVQELSEYWKLFRIDSLKPLTGYEICIASRLDINDKNCVRTSTTSELQDIPGIRHDTGVIAVLTISGFVFGLTILATLYKCVHKLRVITKQHVFIVSSESRETFGDVTEATFTYENQFSDFLLENEDKTEF